MSLKFMAARVAAIAAIGFAGAACASAQTAVADAGRESIAPLRLQPLSFGASGQREMWHTVMLVSAGVALVGLIDGDSTLTVIGVGGVVLSAVESGPSSFRSRNVRRGVEVLRSGPFSFGIDPLGPAGLSRGIGGVQPGGYLQLSFRF